MFFKIKIICLFTAISIGIAAYCNSSTTSDSNINTRPHTSKVSEGVSLPKKNDRGGHAAGMIDNSLVVSGGTRWSEDKTEKIFLNNTLILKGNKWHNGPSLPFPMAYSMFAHDKSGLYIAGGTSDGETMLKEVYRLQSIQEGSRWEKLPDLPEPVGFGAGTILNNTFFVSGGMLNNGKSSNKMWRLNLNDINSGWSECPVIPGNPRYLHAMTANNNNLYIIGGLAKGSPLTPLNDIYEFNSRENSWKRLKDIPFIGYAWVAQPVNNKYLLLTGRADGNIYTGIWIINLDNMAVRKIDDLIIQAATAPLVKVFKNEWWLVGGEPDSKKNRTGKISIINITCNDYENN
ncbi:MAG: kelch repeat-containing protein [Proteiniphilum sp.]